MGGRATRALLALSAALMFTGCLAADAPADTTGADAAFPDKGSEAIDPVAPAAELEVWTTGAYPVNPRFDPNMLDGTSGRNVTLRLHNAEDTVVVTHGFRLDGAEGAEIASVGAGSTGAVTFTLPEPGEYVYYCPVGDHRERGMEGRFIVRAPAGKNA